MTVMKVMKLPKIILKARKGKEKKGLKNPMTLKRRTPTTRTTKLEKQHAWLPRLVLIVLRLQRRHLKVILQKLVLGKLVLLMFWNVIKRHQVIVRT